MKYKKQLIYFGVFLVLSVLLVSFYIIENLIVVLDQASVLSVRPVKHKISKKLIYQEVMYDQDTSSRLDIYAKNSIKNKKLYPVFIFIPGGLWQGHNKKNYAHIAGVVSREGFVYVSVQLPYYFGFITRYFKDQKTLKSRGFKRQEKTLRKALLWIQKNIRQFGGDPSRLVLSGFGSGAYLLGSIFLRPQLESQDFLNIKKSVSKMIFLSPILDVVNTNSAFQKNHIQRIFYGVDVNSLSFLYQKNQINFPILILSPEHDFLFLHEQAKELAKRQKKVKHYIIKGATRKSLIFRLGRKDTATNLLVEHLQ